MKLASTVFLVSTFLATPAMTLAQRSPDTQQQGTGQQSPDLAPSVPSGKAGHPDTSTVPKEQGTPQSNPDTQQGQQPHKNQSGKKHKLKQHGGSHDQGTPQA
ncbi:MAG TPA: hypothetical protein VLJ11_17345 [Bryobacteraceae bacterium]|nr:hypothetical protein [Bryobacteraceae bacterium]